VPPKTAEEIHAYFHPGETTANPLPVLNDSR